MAPSCKFKSPVWEHFDFLVAILLLFYVCRWKNIQIYVMRTCFGCEIQTVYSCLNRTEITENRHQKLKPNRTEPKKIWTMAALMLCKILFATNKLLLQRMVHQNDPMLPGFRRSFDIDTLKYQEGGVDSSIFMYNVSDHRDVTKTKLRWRPFAVQLDSAIFISLRFFSSLSWNLLPELWSK